MELFHALESAAPQGAMQYSRNITRKCYAAFCFRHFLSPTLGGPLSLFDASVEEGR
jgi:hypothetical protein